VAGRFGLDVATAAHAGDGNVHPVILYGAGQTERMLRGADAIVDAALELGGTITGEHGVGSDKVHQMRQRFGAVELAAFRAVKRAFDPEGILNPTILLPPLGGDEPALPLLHDAVSRAIGATVDDAAPPPGDQAGGGDERTEEPSMALDEENLTVEADARMTCADLTAALRAAGLRCPGVDGSAGVLGDLVESSASSELRGALLGVTATLPDGPAVRFGSAAVKDVAGLDAKRLVAGGRGTFGTVERAIFRALPRHRSGP
jgi:glycolate oxidase